ncbi:MAG: hypothetical protein PHQ40_08150, partial [Anaerolineaceae bacterium]|nr:hypothetical protein [Anaerolineaceae bacterium]
WKPYSPLITYSLATPPEYFTNRAVHDPKFAKGIWSINVENGLMEELVPPSRGFSLVDPHWSQDGRLLGFAEVIAMEGSGNFAYYDLEAAQYHALEQSIGEYTWLPGIKRIAYDRLTYAPTGTEQIWTSDLNGKNEQLVSTQVKPGYAFGPLASPKGDMLAYWVSNADATTLALTVQPVLGGDARKLKEFDQVNHTAWSPSGEALVVSVGAYNQRQVIVVTINDGMTKSIAEGGEPAWQPIAP